MARIDIVRSGNRAKFRPSNIAAEFGDTVFWRNLDPDADHWITKEGAPRDVWFDVPVARFVDGQPPDATSSLVVQDADAIAYRCFDHNGETGTINSPALEAALIANAPAPAAAKPRASRRPTRKKTTRKKSPRTTPRKRHGITAAQRRKTPPLQSRPGNRLRKRGQRKSARISASTGSRRNRKETR